jgi:hypothetical protein
MYRNSLFDQDLSEKLKIRALARDFVIDLIEGDDGLSIEAALRETIQRMGVKEFCDRSGMRKSNVNDFLKGRRNIKPETLDAFLQPFGLRTKIIVEKAS